MGSIDSLSLDNGVLILDEDARVTTANYAGNGGRLVMSANFADGLTTPNDYSRLNINGDLTGATPPVELLISGNPPADAVIPELIGVNGGDAADAATHFTGSADSGLYAFILDCNTVGDCSFVRRGFGSAGGVIESYAATLAELSSLPSMRRRLEGRVRSEEEAGEKEDIGVWGRIEGAFASFEPGVSATNSEYEIQDTRIRFGADYPLEDIGLTLGGNLWFGLCHIRTSPQGAARLKPPATPPQFPPLLSGTIFTRTGSFNSPCFQATFPPPASRLPAVMQRRSAYRERRDTVSP